MGVIFICSPQKLSVFVLLVNTGKSSIHGKGLMTKKYMIQGLRQLFEFLGER